MSALTQTPEEWQRRQAAARRMSNSQLARWLERMADPRSAVSGSTLDTDVFSWDGRSPHAFDTDTGPMFATRVGMLWADDAPDYLQTLDYGGGDDLRWADGWVAIVPIGEGGAVLMCRADSMTVDRLKVTIELGPDPYQLSHPECTVIHGAIVRVRSLCEGDLWCYLRRMQEWKRTVSNRAELVALVRELSGMPVFAELP